MIKFVLWDLTTVEKLFSTENPTIISNFEYWSISLVACKKECNKDTVGKYQN